MTASGIVLANYLSHDKILESFGLGREEVRELLSRELLPLYITYYICHAVAMLNA